MGIAEDKKDDPGTPEANSGDRMVEGVMGVMGYAMFSLKTNKKTPL